MPTVQLSDNFLRRLKAFLDSTEAKKLSGHAVSDFWRSHNRNVKMDVTPGRLSITGNSYYNVFQRPTFGRSVGRIARLLRHPQRYTGRLMPRILNLLGMQVHLAYMGVGSAFRAVMSHDPAADVIVNRHRINFLELAKNPGIMGSVKAIKKNYSEKIGMNFGDHITLTYYHANIITGFIDMNRVDRILEIGAGNGTLAAVLHANHKKRYIIVDLPTALAICMAFLARVFPDSQLAMPHEVGSQVPQDADFVFLTPDQIHLIPDNSVQLAVNTASFQEMTALQITEYLALIQRVCANEGYFYNWNRVEKIPVAPATGLIDGTEVPVNRFSDYEWHPSNRIIVNETCRLARLMQRDEVFVRMEQIAK